MKVLVTGAAGFIGFYLVKALLERGDEVVGIDSINDYYDVNLKYARLSECGISKIDSEVFGNIVHSGSYKLYRFIRMKLEDRESMLNLFKHEKFDKVCNLAAQAGVRYSIENPFAYIDSNIVGFINILECCRHNGIKHLVYASSSSVYGMNDKVPFSEEDRVDNPISLYAATKKSNELMAYTYSHLYGLPATGLRFFTVYGPWGRPDMAPILFSSAISSGKPIKVFNNGHLFRDFTYIDDIIAGVVKVIDKVPMKNDKSAAYTVYNIGCSSPVNLMDFIHTMEESIGKKAQMVMMPMQKGDVYKTYADTTKLEKDFGYKPSTSIQEGIGKFIEWYKKFYNV